MNLKIKLKNIIGQNYDPEIELISNGISNINYKIYSNKEEAKYIFTLYPDKKNWWKVDKEIYIEKLLNTNNVKTSRILKCGYIKISGNKNRYILKEFIPDLDFFDYLNNSNKISSEDFSNIFSDLGNTLKKIHAINFNGYGVIKFETNTKSLNSASLSFRNWVDFTDNEMDSRIHVCKNLNRRLKIGTLSSGDIIDIFELSYKFYKIYRLNLKNVNKSKLIHYDILFKNLIIFKEKNSKATLNAIIDNEWMSAGDPLIDLVQFENAIYFNSRKKELKKYWSFFMKAYNENVDLIIDNTFRKKQLIYHMMRSLFYLVEVFRLNQNMQTDLSDEFINDIQDNYIFLKKIINHEKLEFDLPYPASA